MSIHSVFSILFYTFVFLQPLKSYGEENAAEPAAEFYQILSYDQLMQLPVQSRMDYLKGLQYLNIEMDSLQDSEVERFPSAVNGSDGLPVKTESGEVVCPGFIAGSQDKLEARKIFETALDKFREGYHSLDVFMRRLTFQAVIDRPNYDHVGSPQQFLCVLKVPFNEYRSCPPHFVPISTQDKVAKTAKMNFRYFCATKNSFDRLSDEQRKSLTTDISKVIERQKYMQQFAQTEAPKPTIYQPVKKEKYCGDLTLPASLPAKPDPKTCNDKTVADVREKFYRGPGKLCIYGGNLSQYANGEKKAGGCSLRSEFCLESINCINPANGGKWKPTYHCSKDQVICNPLLFGLKADGESPFCVGKNASATAQCESLSEKGPRAIHPFEMGSQIATAKYKDSDKGWKSIRGFENAWDQFAHGYNKLCFGDKAGAAYFCRECHAMKKRLFDLNAVARDYTSCGQALSSLSSPKPSNKKSRVSGTK
jgi:hypothetical protein